MASLKIDIEQVNTAVLDLQTQLTKLESMETSLQSGMGEGWQSANAEKVNEKLQAFHDGVIKIRQSIGSIRAAVSQYKSNVSEVDTNTVTFKAEE